jgi:hypothetical protein
MTLVMMMVTHHGVWASTDHRLTTHPGGTCLSDSSRKHVVARCPDGAVLFSYTGLGKVGSIDVSQWMREVLRGESRSVEETVTGIVQQATAQLGRRAHRQRIRHMFLGGAFVRGECWWLEIRNFDVSTGGEPSEVRPEFALGTARLAAESSVSLAGGSGRDAITKDDRSLLYEVMDRKPRRPEEFMKLLAAVNARAASSNHPNASTVSPAATSIFMPPSGDDVKSGWYGPDEERANAPRGFSHILHGIDLSPMTELAAAWAAGDIADDEIDTRQAQSGPQAVQPKGRRPIPPKR